MAPFCVLGYGNKNSPCLPLAMRDPPRQKPDMIVTGRRQLVIFSSIAALGAPARVLLASGGNQQGHRQNLSTADIEQIIRQDIEQRQYYVTGDLTRSIYSKDCRFIDPTTDVQGLDAYIAAVKSLFDPSDSKHELLEIQVTSPTTIEAKWRLRGSLKLPWRPYIAPYEGTTTYTINDAGLVALHKETWDISLWAAFIQALTPRWLR